MSSKNSPLEENYFKAAQEGDLKILNECLSGGVNVNTVKSGFLGENSCHPDAKFYKLTKNRPQGVCLIINNEKVENHEYRIGASQDMKFIKQIFQNFNYKIQALTNVTSTEMNEAIFDIAISEDNKEYDSLVIFFMSHGSKGEIIGTEGNKNKLNDLIKPLYRSKSLADIPKLIFVQTCRGCPDPLFADDSNDPGNNLSPTVISKDHFLIAYVTTANDVSYRQLDGEGSFFIQCLCNYFKTNGGGEDIWKILDDVNEEVEMKVRQERKRPQTPIFESTLRKTFRFMEE